MIVYDRTRNRKPRAYRQRVGAYTSYSQLQKGLPQRIKITHSLHSGAFGRPTRQRLTTSPCGGLLSTNIHTMAIAVQKQERITMMQQLDDISIDVSWRQIAHDYFGKSSSWIYNKLHGRDGNGGEGGFSEAEKIQLQGALLDISERIRRAANSIQ